MPVALHHDRLPNLQAGSSPRGPEPRLRRTGGFERKIRDKTGRTIDNLRVDDLRGESAKELRDNLAELKLNEYFDGRGSIRFQRLGLTFAAKQHPEVQEQFGTSLNHANGHSHTVKRSAVKAYFCAIEAKEKDLELGRKKRELVLASIGAREKNRVEDVRSRQLDVLFSEIPSFLQHLPPGVEMLDMLPPDYDRDEELRERRVAEKARLELADKRWTAGKQMEWMMTRVEVVALSKVASLWVRAARGGNCPLGMDRPTFCRFILDLGLVDQVKVPYHWAVSLFDSAARKLRCCPSDMPMGGSNQAPIALAANKWVLVSVLDTILRQHFTEETKRFFFASLLNIARLKLPDYIVEESGMRQETLLAESRPESPEGADHTAASGFAKKADADSGQVPGWARDPNQLASMLDIQREEQVRDQLVRSMLVEPEVLHLVAQHQSIFMTLHASYADEHGHLDFPSLLQFCTDFHLTPNICSSHQLTSAFEAAQSLELGQAPPPPPPRAAAPKRGAGAVMPAKRMSSMPPASGFITTPLRSESPGETDHSEQNTQGGRSKRSGAASPLRGERGPSVGRLRMGSDPNRGRQPKAGLTAGKLDDLNRMAMETEVAKKELAGGKRAKRPAGSAQKDGHQYNTSPASVQEAPRWAGMFPDSLAWTQVAIVAAKKAAVAASGAEGDDAPGLRPSIFGLGAFVETLCQVAFVYLGSYGNGLQQNSAGYMRIVWLITYLRSVFFHLAESLSRREEEPQMHPSLLEVLRSAAPEHWLSPPYVSAPLLAPATIKPGLRIVDPASKSKQQKEQQNKLAASFRSKFRCQAKSQEPTTRTNHRHGTLKRVASVESAASGSMVLRAAGSQQSRKKSLSLESHGSAGSLDQELQRELPQVFEDLQPSGRVDSARQLHADPPPAAANAATPRAAAAGDVTPLAPGGRSPRRRRSQSKGKPPEGSRPASGSSQCEATFAEKHVGEPCVEDKYCKLCKRHAEAQRWGNCRCHGCSVVDVLAFENHVFKPLLQLWPDGIEVEPAVARREVVRPERCDLTAPLVGLSVRLAARSPEKRQPAAE